MSRTTESTSSVTTSALRNRALRTPPVDDRLVSLSVSPSRGDETCSAGTSPKMIPVSTETTSVAASTRPSTLNTIQNGISAGRSPTIASTPHTPSSRSEAAAGNAEEHALRQELLHDATPTRAERQPHGDLALATRRTREHEVRDVRARDEQHERDGAEHDQHHRPDIARDVLAVRLEPRGPPLVRVAEPLLELAHRGRRGAPAPAPR